MVFVCRSCSHHKRVLKGLRRAGVDDVEVVRCQKICHGAVAGTVMGGTMEWFERLKGDKSIASLAALARPGGPSPFTPSDLPPRLQRRRLAKRSGRKPR